MLVVVLPEEMAFISLGSLYVVETTGQETFRFLFFGDEKGVCLADHLNLVLYVTQKEIGLA